jgi:hypothetical protein
VRGCHRAANGCGRRHKCGHLGRARVRQRRRKLARARRLSCTTTEWQIRRAGQNRQSRRAKFGITSAHRSCARTSRPRPDDNSGSREASCSRITLRCLLLLTSVHVETRLQPFGPRWRSIFRYLSSHELHSHPTFLHELLAAIAAYRTERRRQFEDPV